MERALNPKVAEAFEKSMERTTAALGKMIEQQTRFGRLLEDQAKRSSQRSRDDERRLRSAVRSGTAQGTLGAHALMRGNQIAGQMPYQEGFLTQMLSGIPILGPAFGGAVGGAQSFYQSFAAQQIGRARAFGATGLGGRAYGAGGHGLTSAGIGLGYGPSELPGLLGGFAQSSGMRGYGLGSAATRALQMQALGGIDMGASGALGNAMLTGTTGSGTSTAEDGVGDMLTEAVAAGISGGIREGRIGEMLQQISSGVTQLRTRGVMVNVGETIALMRGLSNMGGAFGGEAGVAAASSITQGFSGAPDREGVLSALAIRNRMSSSGEDYETASRSIESNPVEAFRSVMGSLSRFRGTRGFETMLRSSMSAMGVSLSREQAHQLAGMNDSDLAGMSGGTSDAGGIVEGYLASNREASAGVMGTASTEAGYEARRAGIGAGMGGTVTAYRDLELSMITAMQPMVQSFASGVLREVSGLFSAFQEGGVGGLFEAAMTRVIEGLRTLGEDVLPELVAIPGLPDDTSGTDMALDAADAVGWALNEGAASVLDAVGAEGSVSRSMHSMGEAHLRSGATRRGGAASTDSATIDTPGGAVRVETTTTVTPVVDDFESAR